MFSIQKNIKVNLVEKLNYYKVNLDLTYKNYSYFIVDGVKKSFYYDIDNIIFVTSIGNIFLDKSSINIGNPFIFYCLTSNYKNNIPKFLRSFKNFILEDIDIFLDPKSFDNILKKINQNEVNIFVVFFDIDSNFSWPINEHIENYTTYLMLKLEAFYIYYLFYNILKKDSFIISDGNILKLKNIIKTIDSQKIIGIIKNQKENYYKFLDLLDTDIDLDKYLLNLPYQHKTANIEIDYNNFKVLSFYFNPMLSKYNTSNNTLIKFSSLLRLENVLNENSDKYLNIVSNFILDITYNVPNLYFRMPENNIIITKLENYLKKFIPSDTILNYFIF